MEKRYEVKSRWDVTILDEEKDEIGILSFDDRNDILPFIEEALKNNHRVVILKIDRFYAVK